MATRLVINYNKKPCYDIVYTTKFDDLKQEMDNLILKIEKYAL